MPFPLLCRIADCQGNTTEHYALPDGMIGWMMFDACGTLRNTGNLPIHLPREAYEERAVAPVHATARPPPVVPPEAEKSSMEEVVSAVISENAQAARDFKAGFPAAINPLVAAAKRRSRYSPAKIKVALSERLGKISM